MSTNSPGPESDADRIRRYLNERPAAMDTLDGIAELWVQSDTGPSGSHAVVVLAGGSTGQRTVAAENLAAALGLKLYRVDLRAVISNFIEETEKNLDRVFEDASSSGAALFFDEADALFGRRTEIKDAHDRYANLETTYLLPRMEAFSGVVLIASNNLEAARVIAKRTRCDRRV
jgi:SpoVK/Ycf46/Vps4 family AAA+-type ATPase